MNIMNIFQKNQKGFVLPLGLMFLAILGVLGTTAYRVSTNDIQIGNNHKASIQAFYAAESGLDYGVVKMREAFKSLTPSMTLTPPTISGVTFDELTLTAVGSATTETLDGTYSGMEATVQDYQLYSKAHIDGSSTTSEINMIVKDQLIPLFQFGIFYENDLEILPGPTMTFTGGRIHSNHDIYLNSNNTFYVDSALTSAGDFHRGRKDSATVSGTVTIKDADGNYQEMNVGFDSTDPNWKDQSEALWGGTVQSQDHGIYELAVPTITEDPRDLLGTGSGSMYEKSGLSIIDGVARDKDGNVVDLTDGGTVTNPISTKSFYDQREEKTITVYEVDMNALQNSSNAMSALSDPPTGGDNNILYVSSSDNSKSVRLTDGSALPPDGLTVASNNPVYIQGDYNSTTNSPASVICDAVNILSNNWNDSNSSKAISYRSASNTTVNTAIIAGDKQTVGSQYSGGAENFPRFLESWSGKTFTYSGSLVCLWESQQATGSWGKSGVYNPPTRNWYYGIDPTSLPPGTPKVRNIEKYGWYQVMD